MGGQMDGRMGGQMDGRMDGQMDGRTDGWGKTYLREYQLLSQKLEKKGKKETDERKLRSFFQQKQIANPTLRIFQKKLRKKGITFLIMDNY